MSDDLNSWRTGPSFGEIGSRKVKVYSPGCEARPHAERNCRCRTFSTMRKAQEYIAEQTSDSVALGYD